MTYPELKTFCESYHVNMAQTTTPNIYRLINRHGKAFELNTSECSTKAITENKDDVFKNYYTDLRNEIRILSRLE